MKIRFILHSSFINQSIFDLKRRSQRRKIMNSLNQNVNSFHERKLFIIVLQSPLSVVVLKKIMIWCFFFLLIRVPHVVVHIVVGRPQNATIPLSFAYHTTPNHRHANVFHPILKWGVSQCTRLFDEKKCLKIQEEQQIRFMKTARSIHFKLERINFELYFFT